MSLSSDPVKMGKWDKLVGCKIRNNLRQSFFWSLVEDKVRNRLTSWKKSFFSKGGRLTLVRSMLRGIPHEGLHMGRGEGRAFG